MSSLLGSGSGNKAERAENCEELHIAKKAKSEDRTNVIGSKNGKRSGKRVYEDDAEIAKTNVSTDRKEK